MQRTRQKDPGIEMVRLMLGRHFITDKKFSSWMLKVDHDENGALDPKEWKRLVRKIKKKDDKSGKHAEWELTSTVAAGSFKACLGSSYDPNVEYSKLQLFYKDLGAWVYPEPTKEELEEQLKQTNLVRNMLAKALDLPASFDVYMADIDEDNSATVSAQEFVKLLMLVQQTSKEFKLTLKLASQCWTHLLLQVNKSDQAKVSEKRKAQSAGDFQYAEVHFSDLKEWIFARQISPAGLKGWQLEDEVNDEHKEEDDDGTMKFFKVAEDAFKYLETINRVVIEELGQGQYMAINAETGDNFFLMEERSNYWCSLCCYPANPLLVKFYNPSAPMIIPEQKKKCCGVSMFTKPESKYFRPAGSARAFLTFGTWSMVFVVVVAWDLCFCFFVNVSNRCFFVQKKVGCITIVRRFRSSPSRGLGVKMFQCVAVAADQRHGCIPKIFQCIPQKLIAVAISNVAVSL